MPRCLTALVAATVVVAGAAPARAWTLAYEAPGECDDGEAFRARAEAQRARGEDAGDVQVQVRAWKDEAAARWRVRVQIDAGGPAPGVRELDGATCREVTDAAALIVALSLDGVLADAPPPAPDPEPSPPPPVRVPAARDPEPVALAVRAPSPPVSLALALHAGVDRGTLPGATPGGRLELVLGWWRASLALGVVGWARVTDRDADGEGVSAGAWQAQVAGRARVWRGLELGGAFEIGQLDAEGVGVDTVIQRTVGWQAVGGQVVWRGRLPGGTDLEYVLEIDGLWPFTRPNFVVDGELRFTPGVGVRAWAGLAWRFL